MKNYYASLNGKCYAFQGKIARDEAVNRQGYKPLTATDAMKQFGYTDSCSRRVIKCTIVSSEEISMAAIGVQS